MGSDITSGQTQNGAVEIDVFPARKFGVKAGANFQQTGDAAAQGDAAGGGASDAADDFEKCAFAGTVGTDDAEDFAGFEREIDVLEGPKSGRRLAAASEGVAQGNEILGAAFGVGVAFGQMGNFDDGHIKRGRWRPLLIGERHLNRG